MPGADLSPGFFGKLPAAGDFVARRLPPDFVRVWDRWAARHLAPRLGRPWPAALRFHLAGPGAPGITGVALPSHDRAGRRFPLTLAAPAAGPAPPPWYAALAEAGAAAAAGTLDPDALDTRLGGLPPAPETAATLGLHLWTGAGSPRPADPEAPGRLLDALLGAVAEAG